MANHRDDASRQRLQGLARSHFDYFAQLHPAFMENAGGSQVPRCVIKAMSEYMSHSYAQLGAGHAISNRADAIVAAARHFMATFFNAHGAGRMALGPSSSRLLESLAHCYAAVLGPEDEVVVQESSHEANVGPWCRAAEAKGSALRLWKLNRSSFRCEVQELQAVLSPHTRIVALSHVSNLLGEVLDLQQVVRLIRQYAPAARIVVDGVAYAPHRTVDVASWGVDYYVISNYKCWGPHMATMFVSDVAGAELVAAGGTAHGPNHYFIPKDNVVYALELGGVNHEGCAGLLGLQDYLVALAAAAGNSCSDGIDGANQPRDVNGVDSQQPLASYISRAQVEAAYEAMEAMEAGPQQLLLNFLSSQQEIQIIGPSERAGDAAVSKTVRVPTVSFVHEQVLPSVIAGAANAAGFAIRNGHMYARRLVEVLVAAGLIKFRGGDTDAAVNEGVVRISLLHYNTEEEVGRLIQVLQQVLNSHKSASD